MFETMKERFSALRELHTVRGLRWNFPPLFWRLNMYVWFGTVVGIFIHLLAPSFFHRSIMAELKSSVESNLFTSLILFAIFTGINAWRNLPTIIAFLRDPTFENE